MLFWRRRQSFLNRPSTTKSFRNHMWVESGNSSPLRNRFSLPVINEEPTGFLVICLREIGGPNTIFRGIQTVIINTFDAGTPRRFAHIRKKVLEFVPALANFNPPTAVSRISYVRAAASDSAPPSPSWRSGHSVANFAAHQAPAAFRDAGPEMVSVDNDTLAAIAFAIPNRAPKSVAASAIKNCQAHETPCCQINELAHGPSVSRIRYVRLFQ